MKTIKIVIVCLLLTSFLIGGLWFYGWSTYPAEKKACAKFLWETRNYSLDKVTQLYAEQAGLNWREAGYEQEKEKIWTKWKALLPPGELKKFHERVLQEFLLQDKFFKALKNKDLSLASKYRSQLQDAKTLFDEMISVYRNHGCE